MKRILAGIALAAVSASIAFAAEDPMAARFGNTVTITDAKGGVTKVHYNKDGTLSAVQPDGTKGTAKWVVKGDKLCITPDAGSMAGKENCNPLAAHKVGDSWEQKAPDGSTWKITLTAGQT